MSFFRNYAVRDVRHQYDLRPRSGRPLPSDLKGAYYKVGPAWRTERCVSHVLDGDGFITKIRFDGQGGAKFTGKYVANTNTRPFWRCGGFDAFSGFPGIPIKNKMNTNVIVLGGDLVVFYEGGRPVRVNSETLDVIGWFWDYQPWHFVNAHPKVHATNATYVVLDVMYKPTWRSELIGSIMRFREFDMVSGRFQRECITEIPGLVYIHDFVLQDDDTYTFVHHPLSINAFQMRGIAGGVFQRKGEPSRSYKVCALSGKVLSRYEIHHNMFITHWMDIKSGRFGICYPGGVQDIHRTKNGNAVYDRERDVITKRSPWVEFPRDGYATYGQTAHPMEGLLSTTDGSILLPARPNQLVGEPCICGNYVLAFVHRHYCYKVPKETVLAVMCRETHTLVEELIFNDPYVPIGLHGCLTPTE